MHVNSEVDEWGLNFVEYPSFDDLVVDSGLDIIVERRAEYNALVTGLTRALGLTACASELSLDVGVKLWTDASVAKSFVPLRGLGKIRHLETRWLWMHDAVAERRVEVCKVNGRANPADVLTKYQPLSWINRS